MRYAGAVVNGPAFGRNVVCDTPFMTVALAPPVQFHPADAPISAKPEVAMVDYVWLARFGVWALAIPEVAIEVHTYPAVRVVGRKR